MRRVPTVLVVEDEPAIAELISVNLRHSGFRPIWAMDSATAQAEIDAMLPDLILLDWMLPGESGLVLAKRWRSHPRTKPVPIIMLTARGDEVDRVAGLDAGADDYIAKPFSTKELLARMRAVMRRRAPEQEAGPIAMGDLVLDADTYRVTFRDQLLKLGPTEFKLLYYLMTHTERVHSRSQLLDKV
jgi:two-component system phosphate regulon response regulator PhoB